MKIGDIKKEILKNKPYIDLEVKKDLAFQVARHFEEARLVKGLTQKELAKKIGTSQSNIARTENGNSLPSLSFLKRVAEAFNTYLLPPKFAFMEKQSNHIVNTNAPNSTNNVYDFPTLTPYFVGDRSNNSQLIINTI
ncbi:MAG: helix-turn-helix transcriptional regulator [Candidatus Pacebacteria bacterium]|nr:helix-turn-helix transcriptional regulator [Candidatus Paceibacterota bacterium]